MASSDAGGLGVTDWAGAQSGSSRLVTANGKRQGDFMTEGNGRMGGAVGAGAVEAKGKVQAGQIRTAEWYQPLAAAHNGQVRNYLFFCIR